jgi:predicted component of type VI protein secretion system
MSKRAKPQSTSKLDGMPQHQRDALERWLFEEKISYDQARSRLFNDFGVRVGSNSTLSSFYQRCSDRRMLDRIAERAAKTNEVVKRFEANPSDTYRALIGLVGQIAFDKSTQDQLDAETIYNFTKLLIADKKENVRQEALALEKKKVELAFEKYRNQVAAAKRTIEAQVRSATKGGGLSAEGLRKIEEAAAIL